MEESSMPETQSRLDRWTRSLTAAGAVMTLAGVVGGGIWAFYTYNDTKMQELQLYADTKEKEFYTSFWNKKMDLFLRTTNAASEMATATSVEDFNKARGEYWEMFYGPLSLVEGPCVKRAMEVFSECVPKEPLTSPDQLPMHGLRQPSYRLAIRLKDELAGSWQHPFSELKLTDRPETCSYDAEIGCR